MNSLRRTESDRYGLKPKTSSSPPSTINQQLFIMDRDLFRSTIEIPNGKVIPGDQQKRDMFSMKEKKVEMAEKRIHFYDHAKNATIFFNSLGTLKILQMAFASAIVGLLWSECRFTYYLSGYCYGPASAFQLQNFPIFISLISIMVNLIILLCWLTTWEQPEPHNLDNKCKRKKVAQVDTMFSFIFVLMYMGGVIVEIWMVIKFNQNYSCAMCYTLALWVIAAACLIANTALYVYNISLCLHQRRLNSIIRVRF